MAAVGDLLKATEGFAEETRRIRELFSGLPVPKRGVPLAGVAASAATRCRQIADQMAYLSDALSIQARTYASATDRGRKLASRKGEGQAAPDLKRRESGSAAGEEDVWADDLTD